VRIAVNTTHSPASTEQMPAESNRSVYVSIVCDLAIAIAKFVAASFTGSSAMLSEGIHSVVDSANGVLLLWGRHASNKRADLDHPFGYGKELYFWTLIVAVLIFAIGGGMSMYEGIEHLLVGHKSTYGPWDYAVLGFAAIFEGITVAIAARDFRRTEGKRGFWTELRASKDPTVFTVLLDNVAALVGLLFAFLGIFLGQMLRLPYLDGVASILIGLTLAAVAVVLAAESKGLLVGEGMDKATLEAIRRLAERDRGVVQAGAPLTMYFGPRSILLALDIQFEQGLSADEVTAAVDRLEKSIRSEYPNIQRIFIEAEALSQTGNAGRPRDRIAVTKSGQTPLGARPDA
jgi:cation diffusion facilitator family transporter